MLKRNFLIILGVLYLILIAGALLYISSQNEFTVQSSDLTTGDVVVLAMQPPRKEAGKAPTTDQSQYIANGTVFLLLRNHGKLFYLPSFQQIGTFTSKRLFTEKSPVYRYLYIGVYQQKENTILYSTFTDANINSLFFFKKCIDPEQIEELSEKIDSKQYISDENYLNAGNITYQPSPGTKHVIKIGHWIYDRPVINSVNLEPATAQEISKQLEIVYKDQRKNVKKQPKEDLKKKKTS